VLILLVDLQDSLPGLLLQLELVAVALAAVARNDENED